MDACAGGLYELKVDNEKLQFKADEKYLESLEVRMIRLFYVYLLIVCL